MTTPIRKLSDFMKAIVIGTGPSLTPDLAQLIRNSGLPKFGCNNTYQEFDLTALLACNPEWWDYYWPRDKRLREGDFAKWTWDKPTAERYGLAHILGEWGDGLSIDSRVIHYGHSSGYQLLNLAYHYMGYGAELILIGYDLRYPEGYKRDKKDPGGDRHYFGEYPPELHHWPQVGPGGEMTGLLDCYLTINPDDYGIRIINCSPNSALDFFETGSLEDEI